MMDARSIFARTALAAVLLCAAAPADAQTSLYRIFLRDGGTLVSYGEYARVADRVVLSVPVGALDGSRLLLVSIAESAVDWNQTEQYTTAVRARHYADTRGPDDFARLGNRVTEALNDIRLTADPARRLSMAEEARRNLARWPSENFGYRAAEVGELVSMLDEVVSELRVAAGQTGFELSLVANTLPEPPLPLLPAPTEREQLEQALTAARLTTDAAERISLMQAIETALRERARGGGWAAALHRGVTAELAGEARTTAAYQDLSRRTMAAATARARRADVRGVEALARSVLAADDRLGRRRPQETASVLAFLDLKLDEARRLRLAMDAWAARAALFESYTGSIKPSIEQLRLARPWLDEIRSLAGPRLAILDRAERRLENARRTFDLALAPPELAPAHGLYAAAFQMAARAAITRRNAVSSNDMRLAWDASSAAAGALMMLERADEELARLTTPPNR
jgi:hypothetical protein